MTLHSTVMLARQWHAGAPSAQPTPTLSPTAFISQPPASPPPCLIATKLTLNVLATAYARHATLSRLAVDHPNGRLPA